MISIGRHPAAWRRDVTFSAGTGLQIDGRGQSSFANPPRRSLLPAFSPLFLRLPLDLLEAWSRSSLRAALLLHRHRLFHRSGFQKSLPTLLLMAPSLAKRSFPS